MVTFREGKDISVDDTEEWNQLPLEIGDVVEVFMGGTSYEVSSETWAAFLVVMIGVEADGSYLLGVRYLGCEEEALAVEMQRDYGDKVAYLHLCLSRPCFEPRELDALHVTRLRVWKWATFKGTEYIPKGLDASVKKWIKEAKKEVEKPKGTPKRSSSRPSALKKPGKGGDGEGKEPGGSGVITQEMKDALREKLKSVKKKVLPTVGPDEVLEVDTDLDGKREEDSETDGECSYVPTPDEERALLTGTAIPEPPFQLAEAEPTKERRREKKSAAIKDITTKSWSGQLILKAVNTTKARKQQAEKKKKKKSGGRDQLTKLLSRILTKETGGKKDKKKKKKKKRKRLKGGVIVSSTGSSSGSSPTEDEEEESDSDLEAPMRKRSRDKPGSVLALLTEHVREQMDQSSLADVPSGSQVLTGGVKIASYFAIHIKGQFPQCFPWRLRWISSERGMSPEWGTALQRGSWRCISRCWTKIGTQQNTWNYIPWTTPTQPHRLWYWRHASARG